MMVLLLLVAAAETDPYIGWLHPPRDGTAALNLIINDKLARGLQNLNAASSSSTTCEEAAGVVLAPLWSTAHYFFVSDMRLWGVDRTPRSAEAYNHLMPVEGTYRYAPLLPFGRLIPVDPTVRVGDVLFGTDKLGHFFTNGPRYLERFRSARERGATVEEAEAAAVRLGVDQENGVLGLGVCGVFSYADLEANWRGMELVRDLCTPVEGATTPRLLRRDGRWSLSAPFDIAAFVNPCWDEAWATSAFSASEAAPVARAVTELCPRFAADDDVRARRKRYALLAPTSCSQRHRALLAPLLAAGIAPAPSPSLEELCPGAR